MARTIDTQADLLALQNAVSQMSVLAASAPTFQAAVTAAREILGAMSEAEKELARVAAATVAARSDLDQLGIDANRVSSELNNLTIELAATRSKLGRLSDEYRDTRDRFDAELEQHRVNETRRVRRELADAEEESSKRIATLTADVDRLEARKAAALDALQAIKAGL